MAMAASTTGWSACVSLVDDLSAREGYRRYLAGSHVIFFRKIKSGIDAIRILHGGMDFEQHL